MSRAVRLCPSLIIVRPDFHKYQAISREIFAIYRSVTPLVEPLSLDEAYLDVTTNAWGETLGVKVARRIKEEIRQRTGLSRQDRVGMAEARRAHGDRARAHREFFAGAAGRCVVGRRAEDGGAFARAWHCQAD
jgi:hypothetical protein